MALEGGDGSASRFRRSFPPGKTRYPFYRRLGGPQSGQVREISPPPGFDPRTVQAVASRYTDYVTRPTFFENLWTKLRFQSDKNSGALHEDQFTFLITSSSILLVMGNVSNKGIEKMFQTKV